MSGIWRYIKHGNVQGPVSSDELKKLAVSGSLKPTDLVREEGSPGWIPASKVRGLFPAPPPKPPVVKPKLPVDEPKTPTVPPAPIAQLMPEVAQPTAQPAANPTTTAPTPAPAPTPVAETSTVEKPTASPVATQPHAPRTRRWGRRLAWAAVPIAAASFFAFRWWEGSVSVDQSRLATVYLAAGFVEQDAGGNDEQGWEGSGVIVEDREDSLVVLTNSHCLGLPLIAAGEAGAPEITTYGILVQFAGKKTRVRATQFAETRVTGLDLALLLVPKGSLTEGRDYAIAPVMPRNRVAQGAKLVLIGAPKGLSGTETNGTASALRKAGEMGPHAVLQTDASMNHGNSGGPCYLEEYGRRFLVAINTFKLKETEGLNFSFYADEADAVDWRWFDATPDGAAAALRDIYDFPKP